MFFQTPPKLLMPLHSLLTTPFTFSAEASVTDKLRSFFEHREDFSSIIEMARIYDSERVRLQSLLPPMRSKLEDQVSIALADLKNLHKVCRASSSITLPAITENMNGEDYLACVSVQCQLERLSDLFVLKRYGSKDPLSEEDICSAIRFLMLNEALSLVLAQLALVKKEENTFYIQPFNQKSLAVLRATWFARWTEQNSHAATFAYVNKLIHSGANAPEAVSLIATRILDRDLSISWMRLSESTKSLKSVDAIHRACMLVAALIFFGIKNMPMKCNKQELEKLGITFDTPSELLRYNTGCLATDKFVIRDGDFLKPLVGSMSKGLRTYFSYLANYYSEVDILRNNVGGKFFEKTIRTVLVSDDDYKGRYHTAEGFDRYQVLRSETPTACDVDLIIFDQQLKHYYFAQIKHSLPGEKAFFNAAVKAVQSDFSEGLRQLRGAKKLLEEGELIETLKKRGLDGASKENSTFILIHNIAQFDYQQTVDGICLYDWASFRNLLLDGQIAMGHSHIPDSNRLVRLKTPLALGCPSNVVQRLLSEHPAYVQIKDQAWMAENVTTSYQIENTRFTLSSLGI